MAGIRKFYANVYTIWLTMSAGIEYNAVKEHYRIYLFKRTVLPLIYFGKYLIRYLGNHPL